MKFRIIEVDDIPLQPTEFNGNYVTHHLFDEGHDGLHAWSAIKPDQPTPISMLGNIAFLERMAVLEATPMSQRTVP